MKKLQSLEIFLVRLRSPVMIAPEKYIKNAELRRHSGICVMRTVMRKIVEKLRSIQGRVEGTVAGAVACAFLAALALAASANSLAILTDSSACIPSSSSYGSFGSIGLAQRAVAGRAGALLATGSELGDAAITLGATGEASGDDVVGFDSGLRPHATKRTAKIDQISLCMKSSPLKRMMPQNCPQNKEIYHDFS
jgi:hypothetical protein